MIFCVKKCFFPNFLFQPAREFQGCIPGRFRELFRKIVSLKLHNYDSLLQFHEINSFIEIQFFGTVEIGRCSDEQRRNSKSKLDKKTGRAQLMQY